MRSSSDKRIVSGESIHSTTVKAWDANRFDAKTESVGISDLTEVELEGLKRAKEKREIEQARRSLALETQTLQAQRAELEAQYAEMIEKAQKESELIKALAQDQGYKDGFDKAEQERQLLVQSLDNLRLEQQNLNTMLSHRIKEICVYVSHKIVGDSAKIHHENAVKNLEILLDETRLDPSAISIKAHPITIDVITTHLQTHSSKKPLSSIRWISDESILPTGFLIDHEFGHVDFSLESRWKRVLSHFDLDHSTASFLAADLAPSPAVLESFSFDELKVRTSGN